LLGLRYFDPLVREEIDGKRELTLPLETVRERFATAATTATDDTGTTPTTTEDSPGSPSSSESAPAPSNVGATPETVLQSTFRGRRLKGRKIELPEDYVGVVLKQGRATHSDEQHKTWEPLLKFDAFTYWNMDQLPSKNDPVVQVSRWDGGASSPVGGVSASVLPMRVSR
jgi:hypothetical protein